jgi:tetratricopeptide (TPR) repeat protein
MKRLPKLLLAGMALGMLILSGTGCAKLRARDELNKGVRAYKAADYETAVNHFKESLSSDPDFATARLYLATAYMSQYIPGAPSEENEEKAKLAFENFQRVLDAEPNNEVAIASIASLRFNQKQFDEAEKWHRRLIDVNPKAKESYYTLGVIAWRLAPP